MSMDMIWDFWQLGFYISGTVFFLIAIKMLRNIVITRIGGNENAEQ